MDKKSRNSNFNADVETALIEDFIQKTISSFGKWGERKEDSADFITHLRSQDDRDY